MKTITYPRFAELVIADAEGDSRSLNQEVWKHERAARARSMPLVIEVHARSVLASRRLTEWWQSGDQLMQDTLHGVYLLRVDLQRFGPEAVLKLTPYAVAGAPLFVGWNEIGQVCSRTQFQELTREAFVLPLSAFFEDVLLGRQHSLNPVPNLGNAERTREALALKRASHALLAAKRSNPVEVVSHGNDFQATEASDEPASAVPKPSADTTMAPRELSALALEQGEPTTDAGGVKLDVLLERARASFGSLEDRIGVPLKLTLEDLRAVDDHLGLKDADERTAFAREFGAVLAVYVGDTIRQRVNADWSLAGTSVSASVLELRGTVHGEDKCVQPMEWVVEILSDSTRSLYGHALSWCRMY